MPEQFVSLSKHVQAITRIEDRVGDVQKDVTEIKDSLRELRKIIVESNGHGKSLVTRARENSEEIDELKKTVRELKLAPLKAKAGIYDTVWKYTIRFAVIFFFGSLGMFLLRDPRIVVEVLKLAFHVK